MTLLFRYARALVAMFFVVAAIALGLEAPSPANAEPVPVYNGRIAFVRGSQGDSQPDLLSIDADGSSLETLSTDAQLPAYSGDGTKLSYCGADGVIVMNADGTDPQNVGKIACGGFRQSFSPDGSSFVNWNGSENALVVTRIIGTPTVLFGNDQVQELFPAFSPDGLKLVFFRFTNSGAEIWISGVDGADAHLVAVAPGNSAHNPSYPSLVPGTTQILFNDYVGDVAKAFIVNVDGTDMHEISTPGAAVLPIPSPDGEWMVFSTNDGLYKARLDGSQRVQLTNDGRDQFATWQSLSEDPAPTATSTSTASTSTTSTSTTSTTIPSVAPVARFSIKQQSPHWLFANGLTSTDTDGIVASYIWRWGDYSKPSTFKYGWHQYKQAGTYLVRLTVTDNTGASTTRGVWIKVT